MGLTVGLPLPLREGVGGGGDTALRPPPPTPSRKGRGSLVVCLRSRTDGLPRLPVTQCLNALSQAALLFFLGVGLTLIFGIMRIVNFAHGAFFMLGAFVGYSAVAHHRQLLGRADRRAAPGRRVRRRVRTRHPAPPVPARPQRLPDGDLRPDADHGRGDPPDLGRRRAGGAGPAVALRHRLHPRRTVPDLPPVPRRRRHRGRASRSGSSWSARGSAC